MKRESLEDHQSQEILVFSNPFYFLEKLLLWKTHCTHWFAGAGVSNVFCKHPDGMKCGLSYAYCVSSYKLLKVSGAPFTWEPHGLWLVPRTGCSLWTLNVLSKVFIQQVILIDEKSKCNFSVFSPAFCFGKFLTPVKLKEYHISSA